MPDGQLTHSGSLWSPRATGLELRTWSPARPMLIVAGLIAAASLVLHLTLARIFDRLGIYFLNDILFASDTHDFLASVAHGAHSVRTLTPDLLNSIHPYVWFYFSPIVRGLASLGNMLHLTDVSVYDLRLAIGVYVIPTVSALQAIAFAFLLHLLGFSLITIVPMAILNEITFSSLLYGSIPDHFAVSNLAITLLLIAAVAAQRDARFNHWGIWIPLGLFATGITTTNVAFFGLAHLFTQLAVGALSFWRAAARSVALSGALLIFVLVSADVAGFLMRGPSNPHHGQDDFIGRYLQVADSLPERVGRAARAVGNSVAPLASDIGTLAPPRTPSEYYPVTRPRMDEFAVYPKFTFEAGNGRSVAGNPLALIGIVGVVAGACLMLARPGLHRTMGAMALAILAFNLVLHSAWGDEYVLYSQHWMTAMLLLVAGVFLAPPAWRTGIAGAVLLFAVAVGLNNAVVLADIVDKLEHDAAVAGWPH